jgi:hypothetical protein
LPKVLKAFGVKRPFVVTDPGLKANGLLDKLLGALGEAPAGVFTDTPPTRPRAASRAAADAYRAAGADGIVAFGGGSSMDLAKAMGLMVTHEGPFERLGGSRARHALHHRHPAARRRANDGRHGQRSLAGRRRHSRQRPQGNVRLPHLVPKLQRSAILSSRSACPRRSPPRPAWMR